jgi:hypothetical protein
LSFNINNFKVIRRRQTFFVALLRTTFPDQAQLVDLYKTYLTSGDHVSTISASEDPGDNLDYLKHLPGTRGVIYYSIAQIRENAESLKNTGAEFVG